MYSDAEPSSCRIVLLYHRVARLDTDPQLLAVTPEHFEEHLEVLNRLATPIRLRELAPGQSVPPRSVAVTFDDGYADNFQFAAPLLSCYEVPATIFATTGNTDTTHEFFWDELDRLILQPHPLPAELMLDCGDSFHRIDSSQCASLGASQWREARSWNVLQPAEAGSRQQLYLDLCGRLHRMTSAQRSNCLHQLQAWAGIGSIGREINRMMRSNELREIAQSRLIEIGAHTVTHPLLTVETVEQQGIEIRQSRQSLERIVGKPVTCFSYPFGTRRDYTPATTNAVKAAGFELACSNFQGVVRSDADRFQLPRLIVRDWDGVEFEQRLSKWLSVVRAVNSVV